MIKLVATDLDDTLLTDDKCVTEGNRQAIRACLDKGIHFVTASGRFNESQLAFIKRIDLNLEKELHIGDGGGTLFNEEKIHRTFGIMDRSFYLELLAEVRALGIPCMVATYENIYYDTKEQPLSAIYGQVKGVRRPYVHYIEDLSDVPNKVLKIIFLRENETVYDKLMSLKRPGLSVFMSTKRLMEVTTDTLCKFNAISALAEQLNIKKEEICCIGDSGNDVGMVRDAGLGLSVQNALSAVKAVSDAVGIKNNNEDGVAWLLEKYIL